MPTPQEIQAWLASNPGATDRDIAAAMNQYGVSAADLSGAMGWDGGMVQNRHDVANAQNFIDQQWGREADTLPGNMDQRNWGILGAAQSMGYDDAMISQITGKPVDQIAAYRQQYAPQIGASAQTFLKDQSTGFFNTPGQYNSQQINGWLSANPGATDKTIAGAMNQYGVTPQQMAQARGMPLADVQSRYNAATAPAQQSGANPMINDLSQHTTGGTGAALGGFLGPAAGMLPSGQSGGGFTQNPYYTQMADEIGRRTQQGLGDAFNQIRSNAVGNGTLGGSRQGVAQGVATGRAMDSMQGQLGGLFGGLYESGQNRDLSRYNIEGNQNLTNQGQWMNFYQGQRGQDLQSIGLGADLYSKGIGGEWAPIQGASGAYAPFTGFGSQTDSSSKGGSWLGALGGAGAGYQMYRGLTNPNSTSGWW